VCQYTSTRVTFDLSAALIFASMVVREGQFKNLA